MGKACGQKYRSGWSPMCFPQVASTWRAGLCAGYFFKKTTMIDVQSLAAPTGSADESTTTEPVAAPSAHDGISKGRTALLLTVLGSSILGAAGVLAIDIRHFSPNGSERAGLEQAMEWQSWAVGGVFGLGLILGAVVWLVMNRLQRNWTDVLQKVRSESELKVDRLRIQVAEKITIEEHLLKLRYTLEEKVAALTRTNEEVQEELDRRKRSERSMAMQSQSLAASKDVLQIHVQARSQELQKLQRQYELILNAAGEGICGVDAGGKITFVNPTAARLMGVEVEKMVGKRESELFGTVSQSDTTITTAKSTSKPSEVTLTRSDNSTFTAEFLRSQIHENEKLVGRVVLFKDITERKQAAEALEHKAAELTRSNAELEQFAFVASHDLQEPLRKIRAFGDRLRTKCGSALPEEGADYLGRMQNAAARMQTLIADLLTFSRVISRTEPFEEVDLGQITREVLSDLEVQIEKTSAKVEVGTLPKIEADPIQIRQLLQNLIGNALKFQRPESKPHIEINAKVMPSDDEYTFIGPICELTVKDNGIGFEEKYLEKIFAVFQRLHNRQEYEGTGIGLAVCRRIVDRHGGNITARSKPNEGATFIVRLPVKPLKRMK